MEWAVRGLTPVNSREGSTVGGCVSPRWGMPRGEAPAEFFLDQSYKKQDFPLFLDPPYAHFSLGQINEKVGCGIYSKKMS